MTPRSDIDPIGMTLELSRLIRRSLVTQQRGPSSCNPIRMHALAFIEDATTMTMTEFAHIMNISPSSASMLIDRMVTSKLVERKHSATNRKQVLLTVTAKGKQLLKKNTEQKKRVLKEIFSVLSMQDKRALHRILENVLSHAH